jgi:hypothetical protein
MSGLSPLPLIRSYSARIARVPILPWTPAPYAKLVVQLDMLNVVGPQGVSPAGQAGDGETSVVVVCSRAIPNFPYTSRNGKAPAVI